MAAANPQVEGPLQTLDRMYNDILVQTGKHFKAASKDGSRNIVGVSNAVRAKASGSMTTYHYALDDLESEITRAKSVLLRDLEKLRAAHAPPAVPAAVAPPTSQPAAPPAPMMEMPSAAAHTMTYAPNQASKPVAPFPDMGMGSSSDVVDLTAPDPKPSPRIPPPSSVKPSPRTTPLGRPEVKPSPKAIPKPTSRPTPPPKVTPVPPPQIPRLQPPPPTTVAQPSPPAPQPPQPAQPSQPAQSAQDITMGSTLSLPDTGGDANMTGTNGELNFTDMQFSLAPPPPSNEAQGAPPAPMPEFDLTTFAPQAGKNQDGQDSAAPNAGGNNSSAASAAPEPPKEAANNSTDEMNIDDLFNLGDASGGNDNIFDLGESGGGNDSAFDNLYFGTNDADMGDFDDAYFGL